MTVSVSRTGFLPPVRASQTRRAGPARPASGQAPFRVAPVAEPRGPRPGANRARDAHAIQEAMPPHFALIADTYGRGDALELMPATGRWLDRRI